MSHLVAKFSDNVISGEVSCDGGLYTVVGFVHWGLRDGTTLQYRAAEPGDLRLSIKGSALPFANPRQAFGPTNSGVAPLDQKGHFNFQIISPNSYYKNDDIMKGVGHGKILVEPILYLTITIPNGTQKVYEIELGSSVPTRSLTNYPGKFIRSTGRNDASYFY